MVREIQPISNIPPDAAPDLGPDPIWDPPDPPSDLIFDDGEPLESNRHRIAMNVLIDSFNQVLRDRNDTFVGGNMFVYFSQEKVFNRDFRGPDVFVALDLPAQRERQGWVIWDEYGRYPDIIIELMSPSTTNIDKTTKKELYERTFRTRYYFVYDPFVPDSLQGWELDASQHYQPIEPNDEGWLWCDATQTWLGLWNGQLRNEPALETCHWLRLYTSDKGLVPLQEDLAQAAQAEAQQAQAEAQQAQAEAQQAQTEAQQAQTEAQQAQTEAQQAQTEAQQAQTEAQQAQTEAQQAQARAERLAAKLKAMGINPDDI